MFKRVLIANRGEIVSRALRTFARLGVTPIVIYHRHDASAPYVREAEAWPLTGETVAETYLNQDQILAIAKAAKAEAIFPGYGFLAENADFAERCAQEGLVFIGPTPTQMRRFGLKHQARALAAQVGVPLTPGSELLSDVAAALAAAERIGYPLMLKTTAGGGGIGLSRCDDAESLQAAFARVTGLGTRFFGDGGVFVERFVPQARHIELQIFGDGQQVWVLGERDCSLQRRQQKVIEETPAPGLGAALRQKMTEAAQALAQAVGYRSAGTVEFIADVQAEQFYFLEVNSRLQVEHPITEAVYGIDLIEWMLLEAALEPLPALPKPQGAAIEVRLYAEDPLKDFQPSAGVLQAVAWPPAVRVDTWVTTGTTVSSLFDPLLAKVIAYGETRTAAREKMSQALETLRLQGITTNQEYLAAILASDFFVKGEVSTTALQNFSYQPAAIQVLAPGTYTTIQDYPGRVGFWDIGVPPSGPMDAYALRLANVLLGNAPTAAALECTLLGPRLQFLQATTIAITGAPIEATLDAEPCPLAQAVSVQAGQILQLGKVKSGCRSYLAVAQGFAVAEYLGSRATFALGGFGGLSGQPLRTHDRLPLVKNPANKVDETGNEKSLAEKALSLLPELNFSNTWRIGVLYGPHGAPDFFSEDFIATFFNSTWEVHYHSNRLGIRLLGAKPAFTRSDGGEAGLHPSNIHDTVYAIGAVNFTGDLPVILTVDGPSLGGFVCPVTIIDSELWKVGQLKPGDSVQFVPVDFAAALAHRRDRELWFANPAQVPGFHPDFFANASVSASTKDAGSVGAAVTEKSAFASQCLLQVLPAQGARPAVVYRQAGDSYVLIEYGENQLDLRLRVRVHLLMKALAELQLPGVFERSPGVRSLQIRFDPLRCDRDFLLKTLATLEANLPENYPDIPSRILYLPLAFEDAATLDAVARYQQSVRSTAPWLPRNAEFIRRINGLDSIEQVMDTLFTAAYLVLGLGDVYLGAPCAVPIDPRHRLVTSKYNPARTYTAEGTVGIGGVYMCIYGMDSPGGYQLVGRTLPIWNHYTQNQDFTPGKPWLLRFFDQVRFYPVSEAEITTLREDFRHGRLRLRIEESVFSWSEHEKFLLENQKSILEFRTSQAKAFVEEVAHWQTFASPVATAEGAAGATLSLDSRNLETLPGESCCAEISGSIWKVLVNHQDAVEKDQAIVIIEAMKMEFTVVAPQAGRVQLLVQVGSPVRAGDPLFVIAKDQ